MRQWIAIWGMVGAIGGCWGCSGTDAGEAGAGSGAKGIRIGVYDSRSIAVAFAGSAKHEALIAEAAKALEDAKAQGDPDMIAYRDRRVWELRYQLHRQGFGTAPVGDILALYPEAVEALMDRHRLVALVSKWDEAGLGRYRGAEQVDITEELLEAPGPSERQRRYALEIRQHKPLSAAQVEEMIRQGH